MFYLIHIMIYFLYTLVQCYRWFLRRMIIPCNLSLDRCWILYCETLALLPLASQSYPTNMVVRHSYCYQNQLLGDSKTHHLWACNRKRSFRDRPFRLRWFWLGLRKECTVYTIPNLCNGYIDWRNIFFCQMHKMWLYFAYWLTINLRNRQFH